MWTSSAKRTIQTSAFFGEAKAFKALDEIDAGECDGLTYDEVEQRFPQVNRARAANKFHYRYPRGESYKDMVDRLEPMLLEIEREETLLVITHQAVNRCLLAYFKNIPVNDLERELPYIEVPLHTVIKVTPVTAGCLIESFKLGPDAVSTHRSADTDRAAVAAGSGGSKKAEQDGFAALLIAAGPDV